MSKKRVQLSTQTIKVIKNCLKEREITQEELALKLMVTPRTLTNWLSGKNPVDFDKLDRIVRIIGIGLEDLFGDDIPQEYVFHQETARVAWWLYKTGVANLFQRTYRKVAELFRKRISFVLVPKKGFFQIVEHDANKEKNYYFQFWIITDEKIETAKFTLSFTIADLLRIDYGEIIVGKEIVDLKAYYQPPDFQVKRPERAICLVKIATWFDEMSHTFIVVSDIKFKIVEKGRISEKELRNSEDIAVFWKHFFFHADT